MKQTTKLLCELIREEVCGVEAEHSSTITETEAKQLYKLAKAHDLVHLLSAPMERLGISPTPEILEKFRSQTFSAVYRQNNISYEMNRISDALEAAGVNFIPLKGAIVRNLYPKPWMRTSCDIDILVKEEDLEIAANSVEKTLSYERKWKNSHEISLYSQNGVHLELHYRLVGDEKREKINSVLDSIWNSTTQKAEGSEELLLNDEMFYFYHVTHMALHFENGGCGIRTFLDMWLLNNRTEYNRELRFKLLRKGGLDRFATAAERLSEVWFGGAVHTDITQELEDYIVGAGAYGSESNSLKVKQTKKGGSFKYLLSRLWVPYDTLKFRYPSLEGKKILTPLYQLRRWLGVLVCNKTKSVADELKKSNALTSDEQKKTAEMLRDLGL